MKNSVTIVFVTFESEHVIGQAIANVTNDPAVSRIIVVDNASRDASVEVATRSSEKVEVIRNAANLGYGPGMNCGLECVDTPFALILNPDVTLQSGDITRLAEIATEHPEAIAVGPWLAGDAGPKASMDVGLVWEPAKIDYLAKTNRHVSILPGAAMFLRMDAFREIGLFDSNLFLFHEEDDFGQRALNAGYDVILTTHVVAGHVSRRSSPPNSAIDRLRYRHMAWSRLYIQDKFRGPKAARQLANSLRQQTRIRLFFFRLLGDSVRALKREQQLLAVDDFLSGRLPPKDLSAYCDETFCTVNDNLRAA